MEKSEEQALNEKVMDEFRRVAGYPAYKYQFKAVTDDATGVTSVYELIGDKTGERVMRIKDGMIKINPECAAKGEKARDRYLKAKEYVSLYEKAPPMEYSGVKDYRKLGEFGDVVLAAKGTERGYEFVTWNIETTGSGVVNGNYFGDFTSAKENFAKRAELIDGMRYFDRDTLESIYRCFYDDMDCERFHLPARDSSSIQKFLAKLNCEFPDREPCHEIRMMRGRRV